MEKGVDPGNLVPRRNHSWQKEFCQVYRTCCNFHKYDEIPSVNESQNENFLQDELLSSVNDPSILLMGHKTNFVLQEFFLVTKFLLLIKFLLLTEPYATLGRVDIVKFLSQY